MSYITNVAVPGTSLGILARSQYPSAFLGEPLAWDRMLANQVIDRPFNVAILSHSAL